MRNYINVIASAAKQSIFLFAAAMDCFAALAMTKGARIRATLSLAIPN
jgi:hypothetical protein